MAPEDPQHQHLDLLGRELKCPICLSLLKEAASLSCNHTFCRTCITQSMKRNPACPICKVYTTRREVRPAPQMDTLVSIYVSMGSVAGIDVTTSQFASANETVQCIMGKEQRKPFSYITNSSKGLQSKSAKDLSNNAKGSEHLFKGPVKPKKRVQVPHFMSLNGELDLQHDDFQIVSKLSNSKQFEQSVTIESPRNKEKHGEKQALPSNTSHITRNKTPNRKRKKSTNLDLQNGTHCIETKGNTTMEVCGKGNLININESFCLDKVNLDHFSNSRQVEQNAAIGSLKNGKNGEEQGLQSKTSHNSSKKARKRKQKISTNLFIENVGCSAKTDSLTTMEDCANCGLVNANEISSLDRLNLDPFFWLRNTNSQDTDVVEPTQRTAELPQITPVEPPNFSDLKESDNLCVQDRNDEEVTKGVVGDGYDSDLFEWTQHVCSPELKCSPDEEMPKEDCINDLSENGKISGKSELSKKKVAPENLLTYAAAEQRSEHAEAALCTPTTIYNSQSKGSVSSECVAGNSIVLSKGKDLAKLLPHEKRALKFAEGQREGDKVKRRKGNMVTALGSSSAVVEVNKYPCAFCKIIGDSEVTGPIMHYNMNGVPLTEWDADAARIFHVHKHCAEWAPDVYFIDDVAKNLPEEVARSGKIKCSNCDKRGAALGCCLKRCRRSYHYHCARTLPCKWDEDRFIMLCPEHVMEKFPTKRRTSNLIQRNNDQQSKDAHAPVIASLRCAFASCRLVLTGSGLNAEGKDQLLSFAKTIGAPVIKAWSSTVTHVIAGTSNGGALRTLKYLMAILEGKWIVRSEWIAACILAGKRVNEEQFEVNTDIHGVSDGPKRGRMLAVAEAPKLFEGLQFYFMPNFPVSYKALLQSLILAGGGVVLGRKPLVSDRDKASTMVVYKHENDEHAEKSNTMKQAEAMRLAAMLNVQTVPHVWILDSIASCQVQPIA